MEDSPSENQLNKTGKKTNLQMVLILTAVMTGMVIIPYLLMSPIVYLCATTEKWNSHLELASGLGTAAGWFYICCIPLIPFQCLLQETKVLGLMIIMYCTALLSGGILLLLGYLLSLA